MKRHLFFLLIFIGISSLTFSQNFSRSKKSKINVEKFVLAHFTDAIDSDSAKIVVFMEVPYHSLQFVKKDKSFRSYYQVSIGVKNKFESDISVAVTGNVGSKSGDGKSAVGKVFIAINFKNKIDTWEFNFNSDRKTNIESAVSNVFSLLNNIL